MIIIVVINVFILMVTTGAYFARVLSMGALAPPILKNMLLAPAIIGHFNTVGKNCGF